MRSRRQGRLDDALVAAADEPTDEGAGAGEAGAAGGRGSAAGARKRRRGEGESEVSGGEGDDDVVVVDLTTSGDDGAQAASGGVHIGQADTCVWSPGTRRG